MSEGKRGEGEGREGRGRLCRTLWITERTWAFVPREVGALEGLGPDSQLLTGALWLLQGGPTVGS